MQFGDVPTPLIGADPEGLVRDIEDGVGFRIREPRCPLGLLVGALCPLDLFSPLDTTDDTIETWA